MHLGRFRWYSLILATLVATQGVEAEQLKVKAVVTQWAPLVLFAQPGDMVTFVKMAAHDTVSIEGMIPDGADAWKSKMGEEAFTITVEKEGAYIYKCTPHMSAGMVGAIVVGDAQPSNLTQLQESLPDVKIGRNMVKRTIRKMTQALEKRSGG
jgi:pseudoazurin